MQRNAATSRVPIFDHELTTAIDNDDAAKIDEALRNGLSPNATLKFSPLLGYAAMVSLVAFRNRCVTRIRRAVAKRSFNCCSSTNATSTN